MKNAKAEKKNPNSAKIAGLTVLEVIFYLLSLPLIVVLTAVFAIQMYDLVPYYSFWPFVGVILAGVLCLVFIIVVMCISLSKRSKRSVLMKTVSIIIAAVMLTSFIAVMLDVVLPDVLAQLTSSTLFYEDLSNAQLAEEQSEFNAQLDRKFIMLNLLNGNYDPQFEYETLKTDSEVIASAKGIVDTIYSYAYLEDREGYDEWFFSDPLYKELFDFIYDNYLLTDTAYSVGVADGNGWGQVYQSKVFPGFGYLPRQAMCHAITEKIFPTFEQLAEEGMSNSRIAELYENNYASLKNDGYLTYDDSMILYATSGRMTVPVVIRLLLDKGYTYTENEQADIVDGEVVEPEGTYFLELYAKDEVLAILNAYALDETVLAWNADETKAVLKKTVDGVKYGEGAVIIPTYTEDEDGNATVSGGYIRAPRQWSILDMDGKNMDVAAIDNMIVDLGSLLGADAAKTINGIVPGICDPQPLTDLLPLVGQLLNTAIGTDVSGLVDKVVTAVTDVVMAATGGAGLYLNLCVNDDGQIEIAISPTNVEVGMHGYQYMTWMESNSLLFAVIGVMSLREWLYIFGAVSVLLAFAAGMCREIKERIKKAYKDNAELAAETAGGDGAAVADDVDASAPVDYASAPVDYASAPADAYAPYGTAVPEDDTVPTSGDTM